MTQEIQCRKSGKIITEAEAKTSDGNCTKCSAKNRGCLSIFIILLLLFVAFKTCSLGLFEDDASKLERIINKHHLRITSDEACQEAGFDAERCEKANTKMIENAAIKAIDKLK